MSTELPPKALEELRKIFKLISLFIDNGLNQDVTVQIKANRINSTTKAVDIGAAFTVAAGGSGIQSLSLETTGWLPFVYVEVSCTIAPISGSVSIYRIRSTEDQVKLVDSLEIRDIATHDPTTDPANIIIQEW